MNNITIRFLSKKGVYSLLDQGLYAGSNFILNILLARWMNASTFGAFSTVNSWFFLLVSIHSAVLIEPMLVFAPVKYKTVFKRYIGYLIKWNLIITFLVGFLLLLTGIKFSDVLLRTSLLGMTISSPFILLQFLLRRSFYANNLPEWAATGGALYTVFMMGGIYFIYKYNFLTPFSAFIIMGIASIGVCIWFIVLIKPEFIINNDELNKKQVLKNHWQFGSWALAAACLTWVPSNFYYSLEAFQGNLNNNAVLRSLQNTILPIQHGITAISMVLLPNFVKELNEKGNKSFTSIICLPTMILLIVAILYWLFLLIFSKQIMFFLYGETYKSYSYLLPVIGIIPIIGVGSSIFSNILRAIEKPKLIFFSYTLGSIFTITFGLISSVNFGITGIVISIIVANFLTMAMMIWFVSKTQKA